MEGNLTHTITCDVCGEKYVGPPGDGAREFCDEHPKKHPGTKMWEAYLSSDGVHFKPEPPRKKLATRYPRQEYGYCHECEENRHWDVEHGFVNYRGLCHILVCSGCGVEVPDFAFERYIATGKIIVPV